MNQPERELLYNYLDEMKKQTTILKQLEEQQEIMIEQNAKQDTSQHESIVPTVGTQGG